MSCSWNEYNCEEDPDDCLLDCYPFDSDGDNSDILKKLSPHVRKRVDALIDLQKQHDQLKAKYVEEKATSEAVLEDKYEKLYEPLYTKRYEIVNGVVEVEGVDLDPAEQGKGVPDFWLIALKSNDIFAEEISERDEEALKFLKDIKWCRINDPKGFKLEFFFDTNPFFKNSVLTKTYHLINDKEAENAIGMDIEWYPEKCLTKKIVYPRGHINNPWPRERFEIPEWKPKVLKIDKTKSWTVDCPSFFDFFKSPEMPEEDSDTDTEPVERFQRRVEQDYELGSEFRDKIIPQAVLWFTGEAAEDDAFVGMKDDTEEDDEFGKYYGWEKYEDDEDEDEYGKYYGWEKDVDDEDDQYAKDYKDHKYEKKSSGPKVSNLATLPSGSSIVQPARSTLNASAPPFIPNLGYGVKKEFNVTTYDSYSKEDDSSDDEYLERMKKKVCQELNLDSSVSKENRYKPWT